MGGIGFISGLSLRPLFPYPPFSSGNEKRRILWHSDYNRRTYSSEVVSVCVSSDNIKQSRSQGAIWILLHSSYLILISTISTPMPHLHHPALLLDEINPSKPAKMPL